jgi:anti-anti-sigma factor
MRTGELQVVVSSVDADHEVRLLGELDMATAEDLRAELARLTDEGATTVTIDMSDLAFIDSTGLSVLIAAFKGLQERGGTMTLRSPNPSARKVLEITGLARIFSIV